MLGHSTVAITLDVYLHVPLATHREAANVMDELFSRQSAASSSARAGPLAERLIKTGSPRSGTCFLNEDERQSVLS